MTPLGFNETPAYRLSPSVSPEVAHRVKLCVHEEHSSRDDLPIFCSVETLEDYYRDHNDGDDAAAALLDAWIDSDFLHIVVYEFQWYDFTMLQHTVDIAEVGWDTWRQRLLEALRSHSRETQVFVVQADILGA